MGTNIVGNLPTCQPLASLQWRGTPLSVAMRPAMGTNKEIGRRLIQTRIALGYEEQAEFCRQINVDKTVYNAFEKGRRRISLDTALAIRARFGIPLDWIYCGDLSQVRGDIYTKLKAAA